MSLVASNRIFPVRASEVVHHRGKTYHTCARERSKRTASNDAGLAAPEASAGMGHNKRREESTQQRERERGREREDGGKTEGEGYSFVFLFLHETVRNFMLHSTRESMFSSVQLCNMDVPVSN